MVELTDYSIFAKLNKEGQRRIKVFNRGHFEEASGTEVEITDTAQLTAALNWVMIPLVKGYGIEVHALLMDIFDGILRQGEGLCANKS